MNTIRPPLHSAPFSPAADRNKLPILEALQALLPPAGRALELASGTGQHAAWMGAGLPGWTWQPTECNEAALPGIATWTGGAGVSNVHAPCLLNVAEPVWPSDDETLASSFAQPFDLVFTANLLHIAPWSICAALMQGAARHLSAEGRLVIYGPFLETGVTPSPGNLAFDQSLRSQNPAWGLRQREAVEQAAAQAGLVPQERREMPSNNLLLVFARAPR